MPELLWHSWRQIRRLNRDSHAPHRPRVLDVGGRKSPYTASLNAAVTILDRPPQSETQQRLNLGLTEERLRQLSKSRSNIEAIVLEDMTSNTLPSESFDGVTCIEVIEHVHEDAKFVRELHRVLRPGGWLYLTTPNGDYVENTNPDHVRHYLATQLDELLRSTFSKVDTYYWVRMGRWYEWGSKSFSLRRPVRLAKSVLGNLVNHVESIAHADQSHGSAHLIAIARK